jgi:short subunit dehydrogenase-like uncharacterized protein
VVWLLYGANGYTGQLVARAAAAAGERPILAGRSEAPVRELAERLGFPWRCFSLERPQLSGADLVLHCAGPFSATSKPMVQACLAHRVDYLDVTGEIDVIEEVLARDSEARAAGVALIPGVGFDVVPSDCLAALLHRKLPAAARLELAFASHGRSSPGTLKTVVENIPRGTRVRRGGKIVKAGILLRTVPFPVSGSRRALAISWGDVASAYRSTGIPDITVYMAASAAVVRAARLQRVFAPVLGLGLVQSFLKRRIERRVEGPRPEERARGSIELWGRVEDAHGKSAEGTMVVPEGYSFTAAAALACVQRVRAGSVRPGASTPSLAFGADFAATLPGVTLRT